MKTENWKKEVYQPGQEVDWEAWRAVAKKVFRRDSRTCKSCKTRFPERQLDAHHLVPRSHGGPDELWNLVTLCSDCHDEIELRGFTTKDEFYQYLKYEKSAGEEVDLDEGVDDPEYQLPWQAIVYGGARPR